MRASVEMGTKWKGPRGKGYCELNPEQPGARRQPVKPGQTETTWHVQRPWDGNMLVVFKG